MRNQIKLIAAIFLVLWMAGWRVTMAREKWPAPDAETKRQLEQIKRLEDQTRSRIEAELAKQSRPYIPQAEKPDDLPQADIPAFPGAEGAGRLTPGGRRGKVYVITSLDDSGTGTLREACEAVGPRIIVFN